MKPINTTIFILFCTSTIILTFFSCSSMVEMEEQKIDLPPTTENITALPTKEGVSTINLEPGFREDQLLLSNGQNLNYKIRVPELEDGEKVPLIIALHWSGDNQTYKEFMDCLVEPALRQTKAIIFAPSEGGSVWWEPNNETRLVTFINLIKERSEIDGSKVAILGYSNGGTSSWYFATEHPSLISAAIPMAGSYAAVSKIDIPTYVIHGDNDELFGHSTSKNTVDQLANNGSDVTFITATGLSHFEACNYTDYLRIAGRWLTEEVWNL